MCMHPRPRLSTMEVSLYFFISVSLNFLKEFSFSLLLCAIDHPRKFGNCD
jgi:hypothetical protein